MVSPCSLFDIYPKLTSWLIWPFVFSVLRKPLFPSWLYKFIFSAVVFSVFSIIYFQSLGLYFVQFETELYDEASYNLIIILLPLTIECWDCSFIPPCPASFILMSKSYHGSLNHFLYHNKENWQFLNAWFISDLVHWNFWT